MQQDQGIAERLEAILNEGGSNRIEVINAGVAAYGTGQELLLFENEVYQYQPDLVMLLFYVGNDVKNNSHAIEIPGGKKELALKPYFNLDRDGDLQLIPGPPPTPQNPLIQGMRRCCWSYNMLEGDVFALLGPTFAREGIEVVGGARNPFREIYDAYPDSTWRHAWRITEALIGRLRDDALARGAPLVVVGIPHGWAIDDQAWHRAMSGHQSRDGQRWPDAPTNRLGEVVARLGLPYVDLLPTFRQALASGEGPIEYPIDGHWTPAGHAVAARAIAASLYSLGATGQ